MENVDNNAAATTATTAPAATVETAESTPEYKDLSELSTPEYTKWRETGEIPKKSAAPPKTEASATSQESAGADDKSAEAAPESAPDKKQEPKPQKNAETRIKELLAERNAEKRAREAAETRLRELENGTERKTDAKPAESSTAAEPTRPKPTPEDVDPKTGQPKYASYEAFSEDLVDWKVEQREAARESAQKAERDKQTKSEREQQAAQQRQADEAALSKAHSEGTKQFKDYDAKLFAQGSPLERVPENSAMDRYLMRTIREDAAFGSKLLYHLASNGAEVDRIAALDADGQNEAMVELKLALKKAPEKKTTAAFTPPSTVGAHGAAPADPAAAAAKNGDFAAYKRAMDAEERKT